MKKRFIIVLFIFTIFSLSLTLVSANWFSDFFGRSTGKITSGVCDNGILEPGEQCDGAWGSIDSCNDFGFSGGTLVCSSSCTFDTSKCVEKTSTTSNNPLPTVSFSASPISINVGQSSTLTWISTDADSCIGYGGMFVGTKATLGSEVVYPTITAVYTITCTGVGGSSSQSISVNVQSAAQATQSGTNTTNRTNQSNQTTINQRPANILIGGTTSGIFYSTHIDDFENRKEQKQNALLVGNKFYNLQLQNDPQIVSGTPVTVSGNLQGNNIIVARSLQATTAAVSYSVSSQNIAGGNKLLLIPVQFTDSPPKPFTPSEIQSRFYGDFNKFYQENSYGKLNWQITASDWIVLPYESKELNNGNVDSKGIYAVAYDALILANQKINLNSYDQILLLYNDAETAGYAFGQAFTDLGIDPPVGVVGAGNIKNEGIVINTLTFIAIHEVGHNLLINNYFLPHANALDCTKSDISYPNNPPCQHLEYGNAFDIMGWGAKGLHFNSYFKEAEGWFDTTNSITSISSSDIYSLAPFETFGGIKSLKIPLQNGQFYYIEYRSQTGYDSRTDYYKDTGLVITLVLPASENYFGPSWYNYLIDAKDFPGTTPYTDRYALQLGDKYEDQLRKVVIGPVTKMDSTEATFDICLGESCFVSVPDNCTDSDGYDLFTRGTVTNSNNGSSYTDYCATPNEIVEYTCGAGKPVSTRAICDNGCLNCENRNSCLNGACEFVNQNQTATCNLISANWSTNEAIEGEIVYLNVQGQNCNGKKVSFEILEKDILSSDDSVQINPKSVTFNGNTTSGTWVAEWQDDGAFEFGGDPEYYFIASSSIKTITSSLLSISKKQKNETCTDSDGGINYEVKGTALDEQGVLWDDSCWSGQSPVNSYSVPSSNYLYERYCPNPGYAKFEAIYTCPNGCVDGACLKNKNTSSLMYPSPFVVNGVADVAIIYGTASGVSALEVVQAGNIQSDLQSRVPELDNVLVRDTDVGNVSNKNLIVVGAAYPGITNSVVPQIIGVGYDIIDQNGNEVQLRPGQFVIASYKNPWLQGKIALLVIGYGVADTVNAVTYLRTQSIQTSTGSVFVGSASTSCTDSDGGSIFVKGQLTTNDPNFQEGDLIDYCTISSDGGLSGGEAPKCEGEECYITEFSCLDNARESVEFMPCPNGCSDGACVEKKQPSCIPSWQCDEWVPCEIGAQRRICNDLNNCGTNENKPEEFRECQNEGEIVPQEQTFFDGFINTIREFFT